MAVGGKRRALAFYFSEVRVSKQLVFHIKNRVSKIGRPHHKLEFLCQKFELSRLDPLIFRKIELSQLNWFFFSKIEFSRRECVSAASCIC